MKGFFKNIASTMYQKIAQQQYLIPLTPQQVYGTLYKSQQRKKSFHQNHQDSQDAKVDEQIWKIMDRFATITPQKQFRMLARDLQSQTVKFRANQLNSHLEEIQAIMVENYQVYKQKIDRALRQTECKKSLSKGKKRSKQLKQKLQLLKKTTNLTKNISQKNIKIKNLKDTLSYLKMLPNLKKMNLVELKMLRIQPKVSKLSCVKHIDKYIERQINNQIKYIVDNLKDLVLNFNANEYENALRIFIITEHKQINYQKLLLKVLENEIRNHQNDDLHDTLTFYIKVMINTHKVCSFHMNIANDQQNYLNKPAIAINSQKLQKKICQIMDQTLAYYSTEIMITSTPREIYNMLYTVNRFLQIGYSYCRHIFTDTIKQIKSHLVRKVKTTSQKCLHELIENLSMQDSSQWSRMPIPNDFRHQGIDRNICTYKRYEQSEIFQQIKKSGLLYLKEGKEEDPQEESWQIRKLQLPAADKIQKFRDSTKLHYENDVVLSQSGLNVLRQYELLSDMLFLIPTISETVMNCMISHIQFYLFYLYSAFLSPSFKNLIQANFDTLEERYLQKRINHKYSALCKFVRNFLNYAVKQIPSVKLQFKQSKKPQRVIIRSRVIPLQSAKFIIAYLSHIFTCTLGNQLLTKAFAKMDNLHLVLKDLAQILFVDCIPKICNLQNTISLITGIKWGDSNDFHGYLPMLINIMKDFFNKIKGLGKGQIPPGIINNLFAIYWKTQLTFMTGTFIKECKPGKLHKSVYELFLDQLFKKVIEQIFANQKEGQTLLKENYRRTKKTISIIYQSEWQSCFNMIKKSLQEYQYILKMTIHIMQASESSLGASPKQLKQREDSILKWIQENLLK